MPLFLSNETLHELAAYLNLVPKRQQSMETEGDEEEISTALLVELLVRPRLTDSNVFVESILLFKGPNFTIVYRNKNTSMISLFTKRITVVNGWWQFFMWSNDNGKSCMFIGSDCVVCLHTELVIEA